MTTETVREMPPWRLWITERQIRQARPPAVQSPPREPTPVAEEPPHADDCAVG